MIKSHLTEVREIMEAAAKAEPKPEPELDRCVWCCPTTCLNCSIEHCSDRLAGGEDVR